MDNLFASEEMIISEAGNILELGKFDSEADAGIFKSLLDEYKKLLKQMKSLVRISDITQEKLNTMSMELEKLSTIDGLTNLYNRRYFNEVYAKEWHNACLSHSPLGILMIDIDYFKKYNDTYGHLQGDECLKKIAEAILRAAESCNSIVARFGGEEFIVLLPDAKTSGCACMAEAIMRNISLLELKNLNGVDQGRVTVSIGISSAVPEEGIDMDTLINLADNALYKAKEDGRNCYREL